MAPFASGKFALRATAQSLAREFGPKGIHIAHAIIDGVIDIPRTKEWPVNGGVEDGKINSDAVRATLSSKVFRCQNANYCSRLPILIGICIHNLVRTLPKSWI